jgi:hypothetical protein
MQGPAIGNEARSGLSLLWPGRLSVTRQREMMGMLAIRGATFTLAHSLVLRPR